MTVNTHTPPGPAHRALPPPFTKTSPSRRPPRTWKVTSAMDLTVCPECAAPAEIEWRAVLESTHGPIEHAKVLCVNQHWFLLPVAGLVSPRPHEGKAGSLGESADRVGAVDREPRRT